jgi:hypothetical protein
LEKSHIPGHDFLGTELQDGAHKWDKIGEAASNRANLHEMKIQTGFHTGTKPPPKAAASASDDDAGAEPEAPAERFVAITLLPAF